jgi:hypothetical protein
VIPDYAFIVRWIHEYCLSSSTANTPEQLCAISKRVLRLFPGVLDSIQETPESLTTLENSFVDSCTYALENVGTESTDELQSALLRIIVDAVATGPAELLPIARFRDMNGMSLLHHTAVLGYLRVATAALSWSADPDALDIDGNTALLYAAEGGFKNFCLTLVQKGAKIDQGNMFEETPLIVATREKKVALHDLLTRGASTATPSPPKSSSSAAALLAEASTAPLPPPLFQSPSVSATTSPVTSPPTSPPLSPRGSSKQQKKPTSTENKGSSSASTTAAVSAPASGTSDAVTMTKSSEKLNLASVASTTSTAAPTPSKGISSFFSRLGRSEKTPAAASQPSTPTPSSPASASPGATSTNPSTSNQSALIVSTSSVGGVGSGDDKSDKEMKSKTPAIVTPLNLSGSIPVTVAGSTSPLVSPVTQQAAREDSDTGSDTGPPVSSSISPPSPSVTPAPASESGGILSLFALGGKKEKDKEKEREREKEKEKEREKLLKEKEKEKEREREKQKEKERKEREERERKEKEKMEKEMKRLKEREKKEKEKKEREEKEKKEKEEKERKEKERKERERVEKEQKKQQQLQEKADKEKKEKERKEKEKLSIPAIATGGQPGASAIAAGASSKLAPKGSKKPGYSSKSRKSDKKPGSRHVSIQRPSSSRRPAKKTDVPISMRALSLERSSSDSDDSDDYFSARESAAIARSEHIKTLIQAHGAKIDLSRRPSRPYLLWCVSYIMCQMDTSSSLKRRLVPRSRSWNSLNRSSLATAKAAFAQKQVSPTSRRKRSASSGSSNTKRMIGTTPATSGSAAPDVTPGSVMAPPPPRLLTLMRLRKPLSSLLAESKADTTTSSAAGISTTASSSSSSAAPSSNPTTSTPETAQSAASQPKPVRPKASTLRPSSSERVSGPTPLSTNSTPQSILMAAATLRPSSTSAPTPDSPKTPSTWEELEAFYRAKDESIMKDIELSLEADISTAKAQLQEMKMEFQSRPVDERSPGSILVNEVSRFYEQADPERLLKEDADHRNAIRATLPDASEEVLSVAAAAHFNAKLPYSVFSRSLRTRRRDQNVEPASNPSNEEGDADYLDPDPLLIFAAPYEAARMIHGGSVMKEFEIFRTASSNPDPRELFAPVQGLGFGIYGQKYSYLATNEASKYDLDVVDENATPLQLVANEVSISRMVSSHPNILKIYSAIYQADPPEGTRRRPPGMGASKTPLIWTVSEHTGGGTLKQVLDASIVASTPSFPEEFIAYVVKKIIYALIYLHEEKRVLHRFLAPLFVRFTSEGQVKVAMSTMSVQLSDVSKRLSTHDNFNDVHIDIWSLGWLILHMVTRDRTWFDISPHVVAYMPNRPSPSTVAEKVSPELLDFLKYCLIEPQSATTLLSVRQDLHSF